MIFNRFKEVAEKYPDRFALNDWTYRDLLEMVLDGRYNKVCESTGEMILVDILRAAFHDRPIIIPPKFRKDEVDIPDVDNKFCLYLYSSGSTGRRKAIKLHEKMLYTNFENAAVSQNLSIDDKILTVCSLNHTGGINAQSLPGLLTGCHVIVEQFNPYNFASLIAHHEISVTHLVPIMIDSLSKTKNFPITLGLRLTVAGSDCVKKEQVEFFLDRNIPFMINYGLTEAGPIIINHTFSNKEELNIFNFGVPLGTKSWCETEFYKKELLLKGNCIACNGWLKTGDCVDKKDEWFMYKGRIYAGCKIIPKSY
jgi:acyl-coenzyme A synthetase/AMP-(fatty) acid ligase